MVQLDGLHTQRSLPAVLPSHVLCNGRGSSFGGSQPSQSPIRKQSRSTELPRAEGAILLASAVLFHRRRQRRQWASSCFTKLTREAVAGTVDGKVEADRVQVTDLIAQSFIKIFNNAFLNTIEQVRTPHLLHVLQNLRNFAARVPPKYRESIEKALRTEGFLSFLLARAAMGLLCAKATIPQSSKAELCKEHEELATVVEELYIAAMLHAEEQWDRELRADGKTFMAVATSFVKHLADPTPLKAANIQSAILGLDANPIIWTRYGLDLLGISINLSVKGDSGEASGDEAPQTADRRKVSLLGGDSLYATAQWAMAKLDSRACRKLIARTIAMYSDGQLRKRELLWNLELSVQECLEIEKTAGVAAFFGASTACAAFVNEVEEGIAQQMAEFGSDIGLVVGLLKDIRSIGIRSALKMGRISAPVIFALEKDPELRVILQRKFQENGDFEEAVKRVKESGMLPTIRLVNRLGFRAAARLECLEDSEEKKALRTLVKGIACLPLIDGGPEDSEKELSKAQLEVLELLPRVEESSSNFFSEKFDLQVENLRLKAELAKVRSAEQRSRGRLDAVRSIASGTQATGAKAARSGPMGLGLEFNEKEIEWLLLRGLGRRAPTPERLDLESLLSCIADDQKEVQRRLMGLSQAAESQKLKKAIGEVFSAGGKRLRPALCLLVHRMLRRVENTRVPHWKAGPAEEKVLLLSTAIEVIHTASLVHDDILDDADTRRQRQTMHKIFGPDVAVLSGDFLFAHASSLVESLEDDEVTRLVSLVIEEFGHGELAQSAKRFDLGVTLDDYLKKSFYKTASLLAAACRASAVLTGSSCEVCDIMYSYGFYLGIAFQIADDVLDFTGTDAELGKPICQDLREGNFTAPVILCLNGSEDLAMSPAPRADLLATLIRRRFAQPGDLELARDIVIQGDGVDRAFQLAGKMANKALEALTLVAPVDSEARRALAGLVRWAVKRSN